MIFELILCVLVLILLNIYLKSNSKKPQEVPGSLKCIPVIPGGWPFFGHYWKDKHLFLYLNKLRDSYGPIFSIQLGWKNIIVINSFDLMRKAFRDQGNNFSGRWQNFFTRDLAKGMGILFVEKDWWAAQRSFSLRALKDFGFGKRLTENVIHQEFEKLANVIKSKSDDSIDTNELFSLMTVNIISDFIMKKDFQKDDNESFEMVMLMKKVSQSADINYVWINLYPFVEWFPKISKKVIDVVYPVKVIRAVDTIVDYIKGIIADHKKDFHENSECQDLIDAFLLEQYKMNKSELEKSSFTDFQLVRLISEILFAGFETTSTTLSYSLLLLAKYPHVQNRLRLEIAKEIGLGKIPEMSHKKSLHYCQAVLDEIYRCSTVLPFAIAHRSLQDAIVDGYFIPADAIIYPNIYACHRDPSYWMKPYDFYPEHFLDEFGHYRPRQEMIVFGIGKRQCLGEALARMEEFIILVRVIQNFEIILDKDYQDLDIVEILKSKGGSTRGPVDHKLRFKDISEKY